MQQASPRRPRLSSIRAAAHTAVTRFEAKVEPRGPSNANNDLGGGDARDGVTMAMAKLNGGAGTVVHEDNKAATQQRRMAHRTSAGEAMRQAMEVLWSLDEGGTGGQPTSNASKAQQQKELPARPPLPPKTLLDFADLAGDTGDLVPPPRFGNLSNEPPSPGLPYLLSTPPQSPNLSSLVAGPSSVPSRPPKDAAPAAYRPPPRSKSFASLRSQALVENVRQGLLVRSPKSNAPPKLPSPPPPLPPKPTATQDVTDGPPTLPAAAKPSGIPLRMAPSFERAPRRSSIPRPEALVLQPPAPLVPRRLGSETGVVSSQPLKSDPSPPVATHQRTFSRTPGIDGVPDLPSSRPTSSTSTNVPASAEPSALRLAPATISEPSRSSHESHVDDDLQEILASVASFAFPSPPSSLRRAGSPSRADSKTSHHSRSDSRSSTASSASSHVSGSARSSDLSNLGGQWVHPSAQHLQSSPMSRVSSAPTSAASAGTFSSAQSASTELTTPSSAGLPPHPRTGRFSRDDHYETPKAHAKRPSEALDFKSASRPTSPLSRPGGVSTTPSSPGKTLRHRSRSFSSFAANFSRHRHTPSTGPAPPLPSAPPSIPWAATGSRARESTSASSVSASSEGHMLAGGIDERRGSTWSVSDDEGTKKKASPGRKFLPSPRKKKNKKSISCMPNTNGDDEVEEVRSSRIGLFSTFSASPKAVAAGLPLPGNRSRASWASMMGTPSSSAPSTPPPSRPSSRSQSRPSSRATSRSRTKSNAASNAAYQQLHTPSLDEVYRELNRATAVESSLGGGGRYPTAGMADGLFGIPSTRGRTANRTLRNEPSLQSLVDQFGRIPVGPPQEQLPLPMYGAATSTGLGPPLVMAAAMRNDWEGTIRKPDERGSQPVPGRMLHRDV